MKKEVETYESLQEFRREQERLIAEGKIQRPQFIDGFDEDSWRAVREGWTLDKVIKEIEGKHGKI